MRRTPEELKKLITIKNAEKAVDAYIAQQVQSLGYNSPDSIAKYLRSNSPFYNECVAIGDWIDACWLKCHELLAKDGILTIEEIIAQLPIYGGVNE